jgi:predicted nucleic acid-binding protein
MKVVVADTSPINYLVLIDCVDLLRELYKRIVIPKLVLDELSAPGAPPRVASWIQSRPDWVEVWAVPESASFLAGINESALDEGEAAAIRLALSEPDSLLLIDESAGRSVATRLGVANTGTLGVLLAAAKEGLIDLRTSLTQLQQTNFRMSKPLIDALLAQAERRDMS